ncbi:hypothetical protein ACFORO_42605 [Amycolatopsis halotolerans]|uniref:Uncharacterized protein n=1 Tax=Amycolatopsis halotolerans TaxID=330083 RepID=A0ABV7QXG4_9PSEU
MTDHNLTYRGVEVPERYSTLTRPDVLGLRAFAAGVDAALDKPTEAAPEYRYFHDTDTPGYRIYFRVTASGKAESLYERGRPVLWHSSSRTIEELTDPDNFAAVPAEQVPESVRNAAVEE